MQKIMDFQNGRRLKQICQLAVERLNLNLNGLKVITEAASGLYAVTPLIATMAGAKEVVCLGKDTAYGTFDEVKSNIYRLADKWDLARPIIITDRTDYRLKGADIVTNLGNVRPLDANILGLIGSQVVIPYMCEAWEVRNGDVNFEFCKRMGIPVMGTDENHPNVGVFKYCGMLAVKMILEAGFEVVDNRIAVLSSDQFGPVIRDAINYCNGYAKLFTSTNSYQEVEHEEWDVIIIAEYTTKGNVLGEKGLISGKRLQRLARNTYGIIQFAGCNELGNVISDVSIYPKQQLQPHKMARTLDYLGISPIIWLHTAGLLVGEKMSKARKNGLCNYNEINNFVCAAAPAQPISYYN